MAALGHPKPGSSGVRATAAAGSITSPKWIVSKRFLMSR
jgi:hypothetical protein